MEVFGSTRSRVAANYALITSDTHVHSPLVGWKNASAIMHISPSLGAKFFQYTVLLESDASSVVPPAGRQRFIFVRDGQCSLQLDTRYELRAGSFAFIPADTAHVIHSKHPARLIVFEKDYEPLAGVAAPTAVVSHLDAIAGEPFMGDPDARLQTLLPIAPELDMAVNVFTYQPGATLPQVEIHVMEHGLEMLRGQGVYRLNDDYFPVTAGDVIWMKSYCPQWFVAMGKTAASYIYYKNIHREYSSSTSV